MESVINGTIRSAFEYSGQKCSACSRMYVPESKWGTVKEGLVREMRNIKLGSPLEPDSFLSAVIDEKVCMRDCSTNIAPNESPQGGGGILCF